jgi:2-isopropylmalate synthase
VARDGAQAETLLNGSQRVQIARAMGKMFGVHGLDHVVFAAGYPSICKEEFEIIRQVAAEVDNVQLATHGRVTPGDIDLGIQALQGVRHGRVTFAIPSSDRHAGLMMHASKEQALQRGIEMARYALDKSNGLAIDVALGSAPRVDPAFLAEMVVRLSEEGVSICKICDSTGELFPLEAHYLFQGVMAHLPPHLRGKLVVGAHLHNDFGFGLVNNLEAARLGVRVLSCSWLGLAERGGLAATEQVIFALSQMGEASDARLAAAAHEIPGRAARLGIREPLWFAEPDLTCLYPLAQMVAGFTHQRVRGTEPVVGTHMNHVATGAYFNNPVAFKPFDPEVLLGVPPKLLLSHLANHSIVEAVAESLGYKLTREQTSKALAWVKTTAYNQGSSLVSHEAFLEYLKTAL